MLFATVLVENLEIDFFIFFVNENDLTAVTSLDDVLKAAGYDNASNSIHIILGDE